MTCWDDCGYTWRAIGENTSCTRDINDGTVVNARLTVEILNIRYDVGCEEPCDHQFDAIVKIYQLYDGDVFETLVYENVDTFDYNSCRIYYKYNEWEVCFYDITESPAEVRIKISHKALCPGCFHPYICDCEDTIGRYQSTCTDAPATTNNPDAETICVELLDVAADYLSIYVEIEIWRDSSIVYTDTEVIYIGNYIDISDSSTEHDWRVACNDIPSSTTATVQLCFSFADSGGGSGSTGDGLVAAQYFDSRNFGETCGCVIRCATENPGPGSEGNNTAPTEIRLDVHEWQGTYISTKSTVPVVTQTILTPSEAMQHNDYWATFMWDTELPPNKYMWVITCLRGPRDGSFRLVYIDYGPSQRDEAFVNGYSHRDFYSRIIGATDTETYQKVISIDDTFGAYSGSNGHEKIKINAANEYKNAMTTKKDSNLVCRGIGVLEGENLSFETGDFTDWTVSANHGTIEVSDEWSSDGTYSAKFHMPAWNPGETGAYIYQDLNILNISPGWKLKFDMYAFGSGTYKLEVYMGTNIVYQYSIPNGEYLDITVDVVSGSYLYIITKYYCCGITSSKTLYIDNIRFVPPDKDLTSVGRIASGSLVKII